MWDYNQIKKCTKFIKTPKNTAYLLVEMEYVTTHKHDVKHMMQVSH